MERYEGGERKQCNYLKFSGTLKQIELQEADDIKIKRWFGSFVGLMENRSRLSIHRLVFFVSLFYIRRIIFVFIIIAIYEQAVFQIFGLILLQLVYMAVLLILSPFADKSEQSQEVQGEMDCLLVLYFLVLFTG